MNDALNFIASANYGIELIFFGKIGEIAAKCAEGGSLNIFFCWFAAFLVRLRWHKIWIKLFKNFVAGAFDIDLETPEHPRRDALSFPQKAE